jgi:hypothetical protein
MTIAGRNSLPGEAPGDKIVRLVKSYDGISLKNDRDRLGRLVARGVDRPEDVVEALTNCGLFALGVWAEAGVVSPILDQKYVTGAAITWCVQIGIALGALVKYRDGGLKPKRGALLHYKTPGENDDHVEFLLSDVDQHWNALHGGGGRADNAITVTKAPGVVLWNNGRKLLQFWDPDKLGIEVLLPTSDINEAYPDQCSA